MGECDESCSIPPSHRIAAARGWIAAAGGHKAPLSQTLRRNSAPFFRVQQIELPPACGLPWIATEPNGPTQPGLRGNNDLDLEGRKLLLQPEGKLPASTTFPSSPSEVLNVISGGKPIVTNNPAENPLQWLHRFPTSVPS